ncbi:MAG: hypothetical protein WA874_22080 [Chryseosolibacter sp.]
MKKLIFTILIPLVFQAATIAQVRVGPFLGYGSELGLWGLGAYSEISLNDRISISPVFTQYFPEDFNNIPRRSVWELNTNLNYYVIRGEVGYLYGLAGVNYTHFKIRTRTATLDVIEKDGNVGLNLGAGTMVRINDLILPFAEAKYTAGGYSQFTLIFGVKFQLGDDNLDEDY